MNYRRNAAPSVSVSGPAGLLMIPVMMGFAACMTGVYLLVLTFIMNLFGISIPVN